MSTLDTYFDTLRVVAKDLELPLWVVHNTFQYRVTKYLNRDSKNGKFIDYTYPVKQYERAEKVFKEYTKRKLKK